MISGVRYDTMYLNFQDLEVLQMNEHSTTEIPDWSSVVLWSQVVLYVLLVSFSVYQRLAQEFVHMHTDPSSRNK